MARTFTGNSLPFVEHYLPTCRYEHLIFAAVSALDFTTIH